MCLTASHFVINLINSPTPMEIPCIYSEVVATPNLLELTSNQFSPPVEVRSSGET
jgi:hypothetical protein